MIAGLVVMLLVGFVMGIVVCEILVGRPSRALAAKAEREAARSLATALNWERIAERTMEEAWSPRVDADNADHSKAAELEGGWHMIGADLESSVFTLWIICIWIIVYALPSLLAFQRDVVNKWSVVVVNVLLGWTLIGWAVALAMAVRTQTTKTA